MTQKAFSISLTVPLESVGSANSSNKNVATTREIAINVGSVNSITTTVQVIHFDTDIMGDTDP